MLSSTIIVTILFSFAFTSSFASTFWDKYEDKDALVDFYKSCRNDKQALCRGILRKDCIKGGNCDLIYRVTETDDAIKFEYFNLETSTSETLSKPMVYMIGISPFEKVGENLTAKCKPKFTLNDFKFFVFKTPGEARKSSFSGTDGGTWNAGEGVFSSTNLINKTIWAESCKEKLEERNYIISQYRGRPITDYQNAAMVANNEFVVILYAKYVIDYTNQEKLMFRDGSQYKWNDGILFTNFENNELPNEETKYQVPESAFSSTTILRASGLAAIMMIVGHIGF